MTNSKPILYIDKIALLEIQNKKLLLTRSHGKDAWFQPGGKREKGETDEQVLVREIKEELNISIIPESISYYATFEAQAYGKPNGVNVRITCYTASYTGVISPGQEIAEAKYFSYNEVPKTTLTGQKILDDLREKGLIDL